MTTIGFVGLGHMGKPMACNLIKAGFVLYVYDVVTEAADALAEHGAISVSSVAELAGVSDVIITSVQTGQQVSDICLGKSGIFSLAKENSLFIDCSSIDITATRQLHAEAKKHHISMLDAPVSGGVAAAMAATLTVMVGGSDDNFARGLPILSHIGKKVIHAGAAGSGQAAKICNNLLLAISMLGVCEAFVLAKQLGLDQKKFFEISSNASGQCWSMTSYCPVPDIIDNVPANNHYQPGFMAKMMLKDLRLGQQAAAMSQVAIPMGATAAELYQLYVDQGFGDTDFSGVINLLGKM